MRRINRHLSKQVIISENSLIGCTVWLGIKINATNFQIDLMQDESAESFASVRQCTQRNPTPQTFFDPSGECAMTDYHLLRCTLMFYVERSNPHSLRGLHCFVRRIRTSECEDDLSSWGPFETNWTLPALTGTKPSMAKRENVKRRFEDVLNQ